MIFASNNSDVGGVGVQINYLETYEKNRKEGVTPNIISSAKFKSIGDPNVPLTSEERALLQRDVDEVHKNFVNAIAENRNLPVEEVEELADGATVLGSRGVELKLIDRIGDMNAVKKYLEETLGMEPKICESYYAE